MPQSNEGATTVRAVGTTLELVEALEAAPGRTITELAAELDVAKSTVHRHVTTLEEYGYVVSDGNEIRLSAGFLRLGNRIRYRNETARRAEPIVETLAAETAERANFFVEESGYSVCLHRKFGEKGVRGDTRIGKRFPMHATAAGKAMLSALSDARVRTIVADRGLPAETENTITTEDALFAELEEIRASSIAINDEEYIPNLRSIGTPVTTEDGELLGAFTVSGPTHRFSEERLDDDLSERLLAAKNELELKVQYGDEY